MSKELFKDFAKGSNQTKEITAGNAVIYNRVSTKEQEENQSLNLQLESCNKYAARYGLNIIKEFGGVFESAKTDKERKEFNKMLKFIRQNKKLNIKYVIVYNTKRFSRTGSTTILEELEEMGVFVLSAMSNYNPKTAAGKFNQRMEAATAAFENEEKSQTTKDLGRARLLEGRWINHAPRGYDQVTTKTKQTITINSEGKFIKMAFHWKADEKLTNTEIMHKLNKLGFKVKYKQEISKILKNPFYCGWMVHNFLDGEAVKGNHPPIVSEETFLKANEVLNTKYTSGYEQKKEKEWSPLTGTLKCPHCKENLTSSLSTKMKKKYNREVGYYACSNSKCIGKFNKSVKDVHHSFQEYLLGISVQGISKDIFEKQLYKLFNNLTKQDKSNAQQMKTHVSKLRTQLKTMENNWALETHHKKKDILWNNIEDTEKKIVEIENEIDKHENSILNLDNYLKYTINMVCNPLKMWNESELGNKQRLQNLIFPEGIIYDKENSHIEPLSINNFFNINSYNIGDCSKKEKGLNSEKSVKSPYVLGAGLEPAQP